MVPRTSVGPAVRLRVLLRYFGRLMLVFAVIETVPAMVALGFGEYEFFIRYAAIVVGLVVAGLLANRVRAPHRVRRHEAYVLVAGIYLLSPLLSAFALSSVGLEYTDALFEAVSGVTTTGLTVVDDLASRPRTLVFSRSYMQWYGGLGIVVFSLVFFVRTSILARHFGNLAGTEDDLVGGTHAHARRALVVYISLTAIAIVAVALTGESLFDSVVYGLASVSTGGFSPRDEGPGASMLTAPVVMFFCVLGALPPSFLVRIRKERLLSLLREPQVAGLAVSAAVITVAAWGTLALAGARGGAAVFGHGTFTAVSAQTTSGFSTTAIETLPSTTLLLLVVAMLVGGSAGSTAGGIKIIRVLIMLRVIGSAITRARLSPHAVHEPMLGGHRIRDEDAEEAWRTLLLFGVVVGLSWFTFVAAGYDALASLFEVASATGTVGLSAGVTSADLSTGLKMVLCVDMWLGRLEVFPCLVLANPFTWVGANLEMA